MSEPLFMVRGGDRDDQGDLLPEHLVEIRRVLRDNGFVLLPSDTAYSVAAWLGNPEMRQQINEMLARENEPISLAFPSLEVVREWTVDNNAADALLDRFTPGPITVVRSASRRIPAEFTSNLLHSLNHTIGVRIPNSAEERQVAGVGNSPITTIPVLGELIGDERPVVASFAEAVGLVGERTDAVGNPPWCAVEGEFRYPKRSTVVEVLGESGTHRILREGFISPEEIAACVAGVAAQEN
jgi:tRNA A37 threonylcarbamoyladenosine synthetase subunit TsaC/SUA5/YrdC